MSGAGAEPRDGGFSLLEAMVSMAVMSVFAAVFTGALIGTFRVFTAAEAETVSQGQVSDTFLRLDRQIRYAAGISAPALIQGHWYVEYLIVDGAAATCHELRLPAAGGSLQQRAWPQGGAAPVFTTRIPGVAPVLENGTTLPPFTRFAPGGDQDFQRLRLYLDGDGSTGSGTNNPLDVTFTAANTSSLTASDALCTEARGLNP